MSTVFEKLNLGEHSQILVIDAPASFESELGQLDDVEVFRSAKGVKRAGFVLAFATKQRQVDACARLVASKTTGDAVVWCAYPKGSSKNYTCEFNRDRGWEALGQAGFEPVRMVAIDQDWSAVRFRRVQFIKSLTRGREHALSTEGRKRASGR